MIRVAQSAGADFGPTQTLAKLANHVAKMAKRKPGSYDAVEVVSQFASRVAEKLRQQQAVASEDRPFKRPFPWRQGGQTRRSRLWLRSSWSTLTRRAPMNPAAPGRTRRSEGSFTGFPGDEAALPRS
jgi:hypothetical protein